MCFVNDLTGRRRRDTSSPGLLRRLEDGLYASLAFPIGVFVGVVFWTLFAIDREVVYPTVVDAYIPAHMNHLMHTMSERTTTTKTKVRH